MKKSYTTLSLLTCASLLLGGCGVKTSYTRPEMEIPTTWAQSLEKRQEQTGRWWQRFNDANLDQLIDEVLQQNNDLAVAALQLNKARLQAQLAESDKLPGLSVEGSGEISRNLGSSSAESTTFSATGAVAYEIDLWNKLGRTADAARWEALATEQDRESTALTLVATATSLYWQIGYLNERLELSNESIDYARRTLKLVEVQKEAGAATGLEILEARRSLFSQEASHTQLVQQQTETRNALAILLGSPPGSLHLHEPTSLKTIALPGIDAGIPAELLGRRPDLRAAEARLRSILATTDATRASYYPSINLSGSYGGSSEQLSRLLSNPVAALGASLALPFIEFRDMQRDIKISENEYQQAIIEFRQSLYTALSEVENTLSARKQYRLQALKLETTLEAARQTEAIYELRYKAGAATLQTWLDAQENRRQAENNLAENHYNQLNNHVSLVKALGGDLSN